MFGLLLRDSFSRHTTATLMLGCLQLKSRVTHSRAQPSMAERGTAGHKDPFCLPSLYGTELLDVSSCSSPKFNKESESSATEPLVL